jgi:hypothetical protein
MQWYYSKNGNQLGPVAQGELISKLASGEVSPTDLVWKDGMGDWIPAAQVADLRQIAPIQETSVTSGPLVESQIKQSPYSPPVTDSSQMSANQPIPNYLWQSIVVTILCCWPLGIPAIVYAAKVEGLKARGDIAGAIQASANAKRWSFIALGGGVIVAVVYIAVMIFAGASGAAGSYPAP